MYQFIWDFYSFQDYNPVPSEVFGVYTWGRQLVVQMFLFLVGVLFQAFHIGEDRTSGETQNIILFCVQFLLFLSVPAYQQIGQGKI